MAKVIDDKRPLPDYNVIELLRHMAVEICDKYCNIRIDVILISWDMIYVKVRYVLTVH